MKIWEGPEKGEIAIPISGLIGKDGFLSINPELIRFFDVRRSQSRLVISAKGYIGRFQIDAENIISVRSMLPMHVVNRMLAVSKSPKKALLPGLDSAGGDLDGLDVFELYCLRLVDLLGQQLRLGLLKEYRVLRHSGAGIRGRIDFSRSIKKRWARGDIVSSESDFYHMTVDNLSNQIIKKSMIKVVRVLDSIGTSLPEVGKRLRMQFPYFAGVSTKSDEYLLGEYDRLKSSILAPSFGKRFYSEIIPVAIWIIKSFYYQVGDDAKGHYPAVAFDMADLFENYIRAILKNAGEDGGYQVLDGNEKKHREKLFFDSSRYETKPDVVFGKDNQVFALGEVKYKNKIKEIDRYQIISHAKAHGVKSCFIVRPTLQAKTAVYFKGKIGAVAPITFYEIHVNMSGADQVSSEKDLISVVERAIHSQDEAVNSNEF